MKKTLMVVDGNSLMYRAFFAMPPLTNKHSEPVGAIYGFFSMLISALDSLAPESLAIAFDMKGKTFRHDIYEQYKGTRKPMPDELIPQFPVLKKALNGMGIKTLQSAGYEADDILGAMSLLAAGNDMTSVLVTGDKDIYQLVSDSCSVLMTRKGVSESLYVDESKLDELYSLSPSQIVDLKGFMGDSSDNIPGVPGVGEKTALKLLHEYKDMDGVYAHIDEQKGKLREKLADNKDLAYLSRELATIDSNVPLDVTLEDIAFSGLIEENTKPVLEDLGFSSLVKRLGYEKSSLSQLTTIEITDMAGLMKLISDIKYTTHIALHLGSEITVSLSQNTEYSIICEHSLLNIDFTRDIVLDALKPILQDSKIPKVFFGAKNISAELALSGIKIDGILFDTKIAEYVINPSSANADIEKLAERYGEGGSASALMGLYLQQKKQLKENDLWYVYNDIEMPLMQVLLDMEDTGFRIDFDLLSEFSKNMTAEIDSLKANIYETSGYDDFNINSTQQLSNVLFERLGLPAEKKTKTGFSTSNEVLESLYDKHPVIDFIMRYRRLAKLKSTYIDGLKEIADTDGFVHTTFVQVSTVTGRISSKEPNLQNIPIRTKQGREIRRLFLPSTPQRKLVTSDYSQIELRILASISGDDVMKQAFFSGDDIHTRTASEVFGVPLDQVTGEMRGSAKAVNFGIVYGISDFGLAKNLGVSVKKAGSYIDRYFMRFSGVKQYMDEIKIKAKQDGYVTTLLGRRRYLPELKSSNYNVRSFGERAALNTPIQGSAADIIKLAMIDVADKLNSGGYASKLILQVHDELIIDTAMDELTAIKALLKQSMETAYELDVPLIADIGVGDNWLEAK
ncbi:MAG: DNA polymerase I [Clostridia bacterium]|jgi:DNA polymerase I|nr:DNA polymerase I [Clostridia bacterium]